MIFGLGLRSPRYAVIILWSPIIGVIYCMFEIEVQLYVFKFLQIYIFVLESEEALLRSPHISINRKSD